MAHDGPYRPPPESPPEALTRLPDLDLFELWLLAPHDGELHRRVMAEMERRASPEHRSEVHARPRTPGGSPITKRGGST